MKRPIRRVIAALAVGSVIAGAVLPGLAAERDEVRRLALENRIAGVLSELNLTPDQKDQLKQVVEAYRAAAAERLDRLAELLTQRRDALLAGDREGAADAARAIRALFQENPLASSDAAREFLSGLTERQAQLLHHILPNLSLREKLLRRESLGTADGRLERRMALERRGMRDRLAPERGALGRRHGPEREMRSPSDRTPHRPKNRMRGFPGTPAMGWGARQGAVEVMLDLLER